MAIIHFTAEDARRIMLPALTAKYAGVLALRNEEAPECEGFACGEYRPGRSIGPHYHIVLGGAGPETRDLVFAVFR